MKLVLNVKNVPKVMKPKKDNIVLYDGKEWYITTKEDLFKEFETKLNELIQENEKIVSEMKKLKVELAQQMIDYGEIIKNFVSKENK